MEGTTPLPENSSENSVRSLSSGLRPSVAAMSCEMATVCGLLCVEVGLTRENRLPTTCVASSAPVATSH